MSGLYIWLVSESHQLRAVGGKLHYQWHGGKDDHSNTITREITFSAKRIFSSAEDGACVCIYAVDVRVCVCMSVFSSRNNIVQFLLI